MRTKSRIIHSARRNFAHYGFYGVSVSQIALYAGVNKASVYYHFQSKENLYRMIFQNSLKRVVKSIYYGLVNARLNMDEEPAQAVLDRFWEANPLIMRLFIHEIAGGGATLRVILHREYKKPPQVIEKLAGIFSVLNPEDASIQPLSEDMMIRNAVQLIAHSLSNRLVAMAIPVIFNEYWSDDHEAFEELLIENE